MVCEKCKIDKTTNEYFYVDGGLGFTDEQMTICKKCVIEYNNSKTKHKYYDEQITALYYGAKKVINGSKLSDVSKDIDNAISEGSNRMGIQNFLYLFGAEKGLVSSSKQMKSIFDKLQSDEENKTIIYADEVSEEDSGILFEGAKKTITVNSYERNPNSRKKCLEYYGYRCKVCDFDFYDTYGEIGKNYIHIHHIKPLHTIGETYEVNPIKDLIPICPNCHSMVHKKNPPLTIEELKSIIKKHND